MSRYGTLKALETLMESFLERVVTLKEKRLLVLEGINQLDDIARQSSRGIDFTDDIGKWFARHNEWLTQKSLKAADVRKINNILAGIRNELTINAEPSAAESKIATEIDRWREKSRSVGQKLILKRGPEERLSQAEAEADTISLFNNELSRMTSLFRDYSHNRVHILSVLDDLLKTAKLQNNKETLILSALIIYYLKHYGYKVEPYVRKLKEAETVLAQGTSNA